MKKIIAVCMIVFMAFSLVNFSISAKTDNLLLNGDLEGEGITPWQSSGPKSTISQSEEAAHGGKYGIAVTERTGKYSTVAQNLYDIYFNNGAGKWQARAWVRLKDATDIRVTCQLVISYSAGGTGTKWITSKSVTLTDKWQEFVIEQDVNIDIYALEAMYLYPQVVGSDENINLDFYMDDASFIKISEVIKPDPNYVPVDVVPNATTENLIPDGSFESGDPEDALTEGSVEFELESDYARTGEYGLLVTGRGHKYSTVKWDLNDVFWENGPGKYRACIYIRLNDKMDVGKNVICEFVIRYTLKGKSRQYIASTRKTLTMEWQKILLDKELNFDPNEVRELCIYPQVLIGGGSEETVDFCVDDISLYKTSEVIKPTGEKNEVEDIEVDTSKAINPIDVSNVERDPALTTVGAIRWDAWYGHDGVTNSVISEVEKTLSPLEFHFRAPFFAEITESGGIVIPEYDQEIFDKEMEYAIESGIDYFAFYWYDNAMGTARKLYQTSKYNDKVKMCIMFGGGNGDAEQHQEMAKLLKEDYYMTVLNGRPLMYYDCSYEEAKTSIAYYRGLCEQLDIPEPYAVCTKANADKAKLAVADAIGDYAISNNSLNIPFKTLAANTEKRWMSHQRSGFQYVPIVTTGYHLLPRFKNQVHWMTIENDKVADYATAEEISAHLTNALNYMQDPEVIERTKANTVLIYAWNEHDEGGWICPTLKVDENGNQLYGENGEKLIDTSRIEAIKKAISEFKANNQNKLNNNLGGNENEGNNVLTYILIGGAVVLVGVAATVVTVIAKKKKAKESN